MFKIFIFGAIIIGLMSNLKAEIIKLSPVSPMSSTPGSITVYSKTKKPTGESKFSHMDCVKIVNSDKHKNYIGKCGVIQFVRWDWSKGKYWMCLWVENPPEQIYPVFFEEDLIPIACSKIDFKKFNEKDKKEIETYLCIPDHE